MMAIYPVDFTYSSEHLIDSKHSIMMRMPTMSNSNSLPPEIFILRIGRQSRGLVQSKDTGED